jgi:GNAT superfamily N-acetyltransferase
MQMTLRAAGVADIFRLQEIERAAAQLFRGSGLIDVDAMSVIGMDDHMRSIDEGLSIVGEVDGRMAGFVMGEMHGADAYLRELDVDPHFQQRGIGAALVKAFAEAAADKRAASIYLSTFRSPPWNAPFYRRHGFADVAEADFLPWMAAIWREQAAFLDMNTRTFMRAPVSAAPAR